MERVTILVGILIAGLGEKCEGKEKNLIDNSVVVTGGKVGWR